MTVAISCRTYKELREALAARRRALGWSQLECDYKSGLQDQYTGKLEIGTRCLGEMSMAVLLETLGVDLLVAPRDGPPAHLGARTGSGGTVRHLAPPKSGA